MNLKNKKGQTTVEYIFTTVMLFTMLLLFYISYSKIVPLQFEQGAKLILTVYDAK
ncbi:MAG: hypothetical protein LBI01_03755 [Elusimicrobium sp.]|jgi:hypothetical protein|nr:hypothetical protein [Elusimicrobium sp.]